MPDPQDTIPKTLKPYFFTDVKPPGLLKSYDVIGFDADSIVKFKVKELTKVLIQTHLLELAYTEGYPDEIKDYDFENDLEVVINGGVFDIEKGTILKLVEGR